MQCVEIRPQADRAPAGSVAQYADDAGSGETGVDFDPERAEFVGDERTCFLFLERGFRMGMQVVPPSAQVRVVFGDLGDDVHSEGLV